MSLPREWSLQDSRGSIYCPSEPDSISGIEYKSGGFIRSPAAIPIIDTATGSQPPPPSILTECQQSGSLFSIHSAPPVPLTELGIVQNENLLGFGCTATGANINGSLDPPRRPASLPIDTACCPPRTLHAGFLQQQPSEIEEDDNENLLTVSSLTARPLIAKSRELRSSRLAEKKGAKTGKGTADANGDAPTGPPDGGYGWLVVFGAFSVQFWVAGLVKSYGVLYVEIMETFPSTSAAVASWIPAILSALCLALAPLSSALCQRFSCRIVVFIGGLFCALGLTLSYFATSLIHLLFTFGILTGIGGGLSTTPGIVIVSQYFDKHRALANGICVSGTAAGSFILPVLIEHLVHHFGFHGTILILGGCMLHVCASATLYRPVESQDESKSNSDNVKQNAGQDCPLTNSTYLDSCDDRINKKYIEHLFLEESKNRLNDYYSSKCGSYGDKVSQLDSDDEGKDTVGETTFTKNIPIPPAYRSSTILHSVEDLSTDSTCVYRKRSTGFDSNRGSRRKKNTASVDEILSKATPILNKDSTPMVTNNRGLSKSMIIPTPVSDFCEGLEDDDVDERITCCDRIQEYLDITLLKDSTFITFCVSVTLMSVGCPYMLYYLPAHAISIGYSKSEAGYLVAASAALDLIGRLGLGWLSDLQLFDRKKFYVVCIIGAGTAVLTIPFVHSIYLVGCAAAMYGLCLGCWYLLMPVLLGDIFGTDRMSSSFGLVRMFQSVGAVSVPPLAGFLRDLSGSYKICFYCMGTSMMMGCIPLLIWAVMQRKKGLLSSSNRDDTEDSYSVA